MNPLQMIKLQLEGMYVWAEYGQPMAMSPEAMAGATAPATLAGLLAQQNAEILAHLTLAQIIAPGTPVLYGTVSTITDMATGNVALGSIETGLITAAAAQLARHYGVPCRSVGGATGFQHAGPPVHAGTGRHAAARGPRRRPLHHLRRHHRVDHDREPPAAGPGRRALRDGAPAGARDRGERRDPRPGPDQGGAAGRASTWTSCTPPSTAGRSTSSRSCCAGTPGRPGRRRARRRRWTWRASGSARSWRSTSRASWSRRWRRNCSTTWTVVRQRTMADFEAAEWD